MNKEEILARSRNEKADEGRIAAESYPKYKFTSRRRYLVLMVFGVLMSSLCLLSYILEGWR